jgi:hypothetical protein
LTETGDLDRERTRRQAVIPSGPLPPAQGEPAFVGRVTTAHPVVDHFLLVNPVTVLGTEGEGNAPARTVDTSVSVPVLAIGPGVPATGDDVDCHHVDYRWVVGHKGNVCPSHVCILVRNCDGTAAAGETVTFTGPGGFTGSAVTDGTGHACVDVTDPGTYVGTTHGQSVNVVVGATCTTYGGTVCLGPSGTLRLKFKYPCPIPAFGGAPFPGLDFTLTKTVGGDVVSGTTDGDGLWTGCIPTGIWTLHVAPPCPYEDFPFPVTVTVPPCAVTSLYTFVVHLDLDPGGYRCCDTVPIPRDGYAVTLPCGAPVTVDDGTVVCVDFVTDRGARLHAVACGDYATNQCILEHKTLTTAMEVSISPCGQTAKLSWFNLFGHSACDVNVPEDINAFLEWDGSCPMTGILPIEVIKDNPGYSSCSFTFAVTRVTISVTLTGTIVDGALSLSGTIPGTVFIPATFSGGLLVSPAGWADTPCPGTITVERSWC